MGTHDKIGRSLSRGPLTAAGTAMLLVLAGCAVGPEYVKPEVKMNDSWSEKGDARVATQSAADSAWWKSFNDPTLDRLIQLAYSQNLPLRIAGLRILEARAVLGIAVGQQYPQLQTAFANATAVGLSKNLANAAGFDHSFWDYQVGFDATWEADFWRKYGKNVRAEEASYLGSVADYQTALVSLSAEVARTYAIIRTFQVLIDQAHQNVTVQAEALRIASARFEHGATSELDVSQATTLLESTKSRIPQLEISLLQAENALSTLLGQPTGTVQSLLQGPAVIPSPPAQVAVSVPAELLRRRPDIRSAEYYAVAQSDRIGVAKADLYPRFMLAGTIGYQTTSGGGVQSSTGGNNNLLDADSLFYMFGPRIVWPIFDYGRTKNRVRVQDARFEQLLVNYQHTVLKAAQEVEDGLGGFLKAQESTVSAQNAVVAAQKSVDISMLQYKEGAVDFQRVLDAERSLLQEQNGLAQTRSSVATNLIALYKALGGGWELREGQPFVPENIQTEMKNRTDWGKYFSEQPTLHTSTESSSSAR